MANISTYLADKLLDHSLKTASFTMPSNIYIALYTSDPTANDSGSEVSGGSYARQSAAFASATNKATSNSALITFPEATANWGTVTHVGIRDASSGGNLLFFGALAASKIVQSGDQFKIKAGSIAASLA